MYKMVMEVLRKIESGIDFYPEINTIEIDFYSMSDADEFIFNSVRQAIRKFEIRFSAEDMVTTYDIYGKQLRIKIW